MEKLKNVVTLFLPYAFCVIAPILSVLFLSNLMMNSYREKLITNKQVSIERAFEGVQKQLDDIENIVNYIGNSELIQKYVYTILGHKENSVEDYLTIIELLKLFEVSEDVAEIYLYDSRENRIITTDSMLSDAEYFFKYAYRIEGRTTAECLERLKQLPVTLEYNEVLPVVLNGKTTQVIECSMKVPFNLVKNYSLQLVVVMETEEIFKNLYDILGTDGEFYVYNQSDRLIFGSGNQYEPLLELSEETDLIAMQSEGESIYGIVLHSKDGTRKVKVYIPDLTELPGDRFDSLYIGLLMVASIVVSVVLCIYFTLKNHREIQDVMGLFGHRGEDAEGEASFGDAYGYAAIRKHVDRLVNENAVFLEQIARLDELKKYQLLNKLIHNESGEMIKTQIDTDLEVKDDKNVVFCIRYEGADYRKFVTDNVTIKDFVKMFLKEISDREMEIFDPSARETVCVIFGVDKENVDVLMRDIVARMNIDIFYAGGIQVIMGVGNVVESIYEISDSYNQAKAVMNYRKITGKNVLLYSELMCLTDDYYYPRELDEILYNYVVAGKLEDAKALVAQLYKENIEKGSKMLTIAAIDKIKSRLTDALVSMTEQYDISDRDMVSQLKQEKNIEAYFTQVYHFIDRIAGEVGGKRKNLNETVVTKTMDYINANYADSSLSLSKISYELGFQKDYISKLFKAEYGENLSVVIEKLRIEKACELLKSTDMKIVDISETVGYNSDISFRRAFKKVTGLTPVEYKGMQ